MFLNKIYSLTDTKNFDEILKSQEDLKQIIRETITGICEGKSANKFMNVYELAIRSAQDKHDVVEWVFKLMTSKEKLGLEQAITRIDISLDEQ